MGSRPLLRSIAIAGAVLCPLVALADGPFEDVHVAANRSDYAGRCPVLLMFTANVELAPHARRMAFNYQWQRSDGTKGPVRVIHASPRETKFVFRDSFRAGRRGGDREASDTIVLNAGDMQARFMSPTVRMSCR